MTSLVDSSWAASSDGDFSIKNLPYGVFSMPGRGLGPRCGVAIGDSVLDLSAIDTAGLFSEVAGLPAGAFAEPTLNKFMATPRATWQAVRGRLQELLSSGAPLLRKLRPDAPPRPPRPPAALEQHGGLEVHELDLFCEFCSATNRAAHMPRFPRSFISCTARQRWAAILPSQAMQHFGPWRSCRWRT